MTSNPLCGGEITVDDPALLCAEAAKAIGAAHQNQTNDSDEVVDFDGLKVAVDQMSSMYLEGVEIDYIETLEGAGFKFNNPNVKSTCGCGSSFSV